jgi:hypothetical protein
VKLIGIEEHFLTAEIRDAWSAIGLDAVDPSVAFHSGAIGGHHCVGGLDHVQSAFLLPALCHYSTRTSYTADERRSTPAKLLSLVST